MNRNPYITYLNRYTTVSPEHEAAFDEFISQATPPSGEPLRLKTKIEDFLRTKFKEDHPPSIILTGNAGDGKTYLCRQIIEVFSSSAFSGWDSHTDWSIEHDGLTLHVIKDFSETTERAGEEILRELERSLHESPVQNMFLVAANEGRLRAVLNRAQLTDLHEIVDHQLKEGPELHNNRLIVLNLNNITTSSYIPQALDWFTNPDHWSACHGCPALDVCPIRFNARCLAEHHIQERLQQLYQVLERLGVHITVRDMLIHLAYTITGGMDCEQVIQHRHDFEREAYQYSYYENIWGITATETFKRKCLVINELQRINVGDTSIFAVDNFIINGNFSDEESQEEYIRLFQPTLDLGVRQFDQYRTTYLRGGAAAPRSNDEHPLLEWLPRCRRKLFFEWHNKELADRLFPFLYLSDYFQLLKGDQVRLEHRTSQLILGLNRAFSGLFLTKSDELYITSQYAHAVEQPVPIIRITISGRYITLKTTSDKTDAYDRDWINLVLVVPPPPLHVASEPYEWHIDLLEFEYLLRRAHGGTPNVLSAECELSIRQLKDELLSKFDPEKNTSNSGDKKIEFFATESNQYELRTIWLDEDGHIRM